MMEELALHILDIMENSLAAGASLLELTILEDPVANRMIIELTDNGRGMSEKERQAALDPFFTSRTTRRVGLGLSLLRATAEQCGGSLTLVSQPGKGTRVVVTLELNHIDRPPLGDMGATIASILSREDPPEVYYYHQRGKEAFEFSTSWLKEQLGDIPVNLAPVLKWVQSHIDEGLKALYGGE
ncbi:MAG: ATP-binding protein [Thermanaeromonas sp.]|uniref:ATP-binding protein n=1 Tax=Thermanaeromonas sp. TaxID=2003697 RepID=UPI00243BA7FF|nr:ATP-binding protein [Thermanaeromonas sp.]MCG0277480.1 ATP-binding protein [Thermanaeromonas sp.]